MNKNLLQTLLGALAVTVPAGGAAPSAEAAGRTLTAADTGTTLTYTGATAANFTIPKDLAPGFKVKVVQGAAGVVTIAAASGVTVAGANGVKTLGANAVIEVVNTAANKYSVTGDAGASA